MKYLRSASTGRLLALVASLVVIIAGGAAIAVAATSSGPVPKAQSLAAAVHQGLTGPQIQGITANVSFTNNLIDSSDFTGQGKDPILQGASGRLWMSNDGRMRIELQSGNGDTQIVVNQRSFWISDPSANTVYEGTLPAGKTDHGSGTSNGSSIPSVATIQSELTQLMQKVNVSGAQPTDVGGQPAYRVAISPKHDGGLLGSAQLAWDAARGVPLEIGIYARGNTTPVLDLKATSISYGQVPASDFTVSPPAGAKVVKLGSPGANPTAPLGGLKHAHPAHVTGLTAVAHRVPFTLAAPDSLVGLPRHTVSLLDSGGKPAALISYGQNLGGMVVIEQAAGSGGTSTPSTPSTSSTSSGLAGGLSLPTVTIHGAKGQELSTALGTVIHFSRDGVSYTVLGSVPAAAAEMAARGL